MKRIVPLLFALAALPASAQREMTLRACIEQALARNVQVKQLETARKSQEVTLNTARHSRLPEVTAAGSQSFDFGRGLTSENTYVSRNTQSTSLSVSASVPLFTGFRLPNQTAQARLDLAAATADLEKAREDLSVQVAQAYLQALYERDLLRTAEQQLLLSRKQLERVEGLFEHEKAAGAEVAQARALVAQDDLSRVQADNSYKLALLDLSQLIEAPSPDSLTVCDPEDLPPEAIEGSPEEIFEQAVAAKPAIKADSLRMESAERAVKIAKSGYWPTFSLGAGLGTSFYKTNGLDNSPFGRQLRDNFSKTVGLSLNIPVFNRFATRNAVRSARIERENRQWQLEATRKALYKEIQQAWYNAVAAQAKYGSSKAAEAEAEASFQLMTKKYETGKAYATEYEEARTKLLKARNDRTAARYEYLFRTKILQFYRGEPIE